MAKQLKAIGQKPISTLVDITNYIMIDLGRPLHVYDMATLKGGLVARRGRPGEQVLALNGKSYAVDESMTVIADDEAVHAIGGKIGRASCRERVGQYVEISGVAVSLKKTQTTATHTIPSN